MLHMYEAIIITKTLMPVLLPQIAKQHKCNYELLFPLTRYDRDYILFKQP